MPGVPISVKNWKIKVERQMLLRELDMREVVYDALLTRLDRTAPTGDPMWDGNR